MAYTNNAALEDSGSVATWVIVDTGFFRFRWIIAFDNLGEDWTGMIAGTVGKSIREIRIPLHGLLDEDESNFDGRWTIRNLLYTVSEAFV